VLALALTAVPAATRADLWTDVESLLERLEYDEAVARLAPVAADPERPARDRLRALELTAVAHVGAGRDEEARGQFALLRARDPGWTLEDATYSPKIRQLFDAAAGGEAPAVAELGLAADPAGATEVLVHARFDAAQLLGDRLELRFRWSDAGPWSTAAGVREAGGGSFRVPRTAGAPGTMRLRAVAALRAPSGHLVGRAGTDEAPIVLEIPPPVEPEPAPAGASRGRTRSIFGQWWFWTGVGVLVAGGVGLALVATSGEDRAEPTLGSQTMR
jgi:hypothetical protein